MTVFGGCTDLRRRQSEVELGDGAAALPVGVEFRDRVLSAGTSGQVGRRPCCACAPPCLLVIGRPAGRAVPFSRSPAALSKRPRHFWRSKSRQQRLSARQERQQRLSAPRERLSGGRRGRRSDPVQHEGAELIGQPVPGRNRPAGQRDRLHQPAVGRTLRVDVLDPDRHAGAGGLPQHVDRLGRAELPVVVGRFGAARIRWTSTVNWSAVAGTGSRQRWWVTSPLRSRFGRGSRVIIAPNSSSAIGTSPAARSATSSSSVSVLVIATVGASRRSRMPAGPSAATAASMSSGSSQRR